MSHATRIVVLDDDPTGTQSARDVTVLLERSADALFDVLAVDRAVYVQTNSRALPEPDAVAMVRCIRASAEEAARRLGVDVRFVLRGDSTLRGHVFAESAVFADDDAVLLFVPAFPGGGRVTCDGVHYVRQGAVLVPVGETEFARDPVFGFASSRLIDFAAERTEAPVVTVTLDDLRSGRMTAALLTAPERSVVIPDVMEDDDILDIARAVEAAWSRRRVVVRSAAPLAAELAGVPSTQLIDPVVLGGAGSVLVVCGSHTEVATAQVAQLARVVGDPTVIATSGALADPVTEGARAAAAEFARARPSGVHFLATERDRSHAHGTLADGAAVMEALTTATRLLAREVDAVVTKGGITAAEVLSHGLGTRRARVIGQVRAGVSLWRAAAADGREIPFVIVPGNMGDADILTAAVAWLRA